MYENDQDLSHPVLLLMKLSADELTTGGGRQPPVSPSERKTGLQNPLEMQAPPESKWPVGR